MSCEGSITVVDNAEITVLDGCPPKIIQVGTQGATGAGVPAGGTTGQFLAKTSNTDYDTQWVTGGGGGGVTSVNGQTGVVVLTKADIGLGNVDNTSDANKPVSTAQQAALNLKADISGQVFTGAISATNLSGTNTGDQTSVSGNAGTATALATGRTISISGDLAYTSPNFDGTSNVSAVGTLATVNANVGTFTNANITVDAKGRVTAASNGSGGGAVWGSITGTLSSQTDLQNALNAKENSITAGTTTQYYRGDKTFQPLNTAAVPESSSLYFTNARAIAAPLTGFTAGAGTVTATDTILQAVQKLDGNTSLRLLASNNLSDLGSAATARANLGVNKRGISFNFPLTSAFNGTFVLASSARVAGTINSIKNLKTSSGTVTASIQINGVAVTGLSSLSVTSTPQSPNASAANTFAVGDRITLVLASNALAADLEAELEITV